MTETSQRTDEIDDAKPNKRGIKRPLVAMLAGALFAILSVSILTSGAALKGVGVLIVGAACACIGIDPSGSKQTPGR